MFPPTIVNDGSRHTESGTIAYGRSKATTEDHLPYQSSMSSSSLSSSNLSPSTVEEERKSIDFGERKPRYSDTSSLVTLASGDPRVQELQMQVEFLLEKYHNQTQVVTVMIFLLDD